MTNTPAHGPEHPLGVALMDEDHAALEALFVGVGTLPEAELPALFTRVKAETEAHFAREEALMRQHDVPVLFCHIAQHQRILDLLKAAQGFIDKGDMPRLRVFLGEMLPTEIEAHINSVDRLSARFIAGELPTGATSNLRLPEGEGAAPAKCCG